MAHYLASGAKTANDEILRVFAAFFFTRGGDAVMMVASGDDGLGA